MSAGSHGFLVRIERLALTTPSTNFNGAASSNQAIAKFTNQAATLDAADPLGWAAGEFVLPSDVVYLDGNSLGALPKAAREAVTRVTEIEWGQSLIRSWNNHGWFDKPVTVGEKLAPLLGAAPGQVLIGDSISINVFKVIHAAMDMQPGRTVVMADATSFPSDLYVAQSAVDQRPGCSFVVALDVDDVARRLASPEASSIAAILINHIDFRSGRVHDMTSLTALAQSKGVLTIWDLSHSAGAIPVTLDAAKADFAIGCTYKYLNGGPGAPGFIYVATRHQQQAQQPLTGWWGHAAPFAFENTYTPAAGITRFSTGTQPMISFAALEASLDLWARVNMAELRTKSLSLTDLFIEAVGALDHSGTLRMGTPTVHGERGSHVIYHHEHGYPIMQALIAEGIIGDFREPDVLRFGFAPLYNSHADVVTAAAALCRIVADRSWDQPAFTNRRLVT
jgi:kynureninase